jgi:2-oxo-3-hexenedioate decarboxylase
VSWDVQSAASALLDAERARREIAPLSDEWPAMDMATGYAVQDEVIRRREGSGERIVGVKLGLTSKAKQRRMKVDIPVIGHLTDAMILASGEPVPLGELIHPRVEPEIVFVLGRPLAGPGVTAAQALGAVSAVCAGVEVIDSRYEAFRFLGPDVVADNTSAARFVVGPLSVSPERLDLSLEACLVSVEGRVTDSAAGAAVLGHPAEALALAANELGSRGTVLEAGWVVLTGGMTDAVAMQGTPGGISFEWTSLGSISLRAA